MENELARIREIVGQRGWIDAPDAMGPYLEESRGRFHARARAVVRPVSTAQVAEIVRLCHHQRIGIVPQGGHTGRCGGAVPAPGRGEIILSLERMRRIRHVDPLDHTLTAEAGCILADIHAAATAADRLFPLRLGSEGSCQIGGNLATNAGGTNVLHYGNARDLALGLEVVLPSGDVWNGLNRLRKNNTGYDLKNLFIGAEGTLGIITAAVLKLFSMPRDTKTAFVALDTLEDCVALLARGRAASGDALTTFELISRTALEFALAHVPGCRDPFDVACNWYVLMVFSGAGAASDMGRALDGTLIEAFEHKQVRDAVIASSDAQSRGLWRLREGVVEAQLHEGASIKHDISVPVSEVPAFIRRADAWVTQEVPGIRVCAFGHLGDGNIHYNLSQPGGMQRDAFLALGERLSGAIHDIVMEMGGSFSAEHGIGQLKVGEMARYKSAIELDLMGKIKQALDPRGIMNPGKVLPSMNRDAGD